MNRRSSRNLIQFSKTLKSNYNYYSAVNRHNTSNSHRAALISFNSFKSSTTPFLHTCPWTRFGETPKSIYYEVENEAKEGSNCDPVIPTTNCTYTKNGKEEENLTSIKQGDIVNLSDLLFTKNRDYLIKCNDQQRVKAEHLVGKVVAIYFDSVMNMGEVFLTSLMRIYKDLQPNNNFEVVFVDVNDSFGSEITYYEDMISRMPWTAIPLSDITFRKHLKRRFGILERMIILETLIVVDPMGIISQYPARPIFLNYGALGYPFSDERIDFLKSKDAAAARHPSLQTLLASPERDYLISNKGDKVPIHTLEDKVVALFFYEEGFTDEEITQELKMAYKELAKNNKKFEVVLIYRFDGQRSWGYKSDESFRKTFKTMPWLALPSDDSHHRMLKRIFYFPYEIDEGPEFALIIIGPHFEYMEPYGVFILQNFKISAYPFSRDKIANLITEEAKKLKLEMLWDPNSVFGGKYGSQVQFSQLANKRVIILFNRGWLSNSDIEFVDTLKERYIHMKGTGDEFEVIHITLLSSKTEHVVNNLPWFVQPLCDDDYIACVSILFDLLFFRYRYEGSVSLIAFDRDGRLVRKTLIPTFEDMDFPFYAGGLEKEALSQLVDIFGWNNLRDGCRRMIYAYK